MKNLIFKTIIIITIFHSFAVESISNDGFAENTAEGLVFSKTEGITIEKEMLKVSIDRVDVEYIFRNITDKNIEATIAFPIPEISCDWTSGSFYPEEFTATVNGRNPDLKTEVKAVLVNNYGEWWWQNKTGLKPGQDVTGLLVDNNIPLDCREIVEFSKSYDEITSDKFKLSPEYSKLVKLGLACCDPLSDPPNVDFTTRVKHYWEQSFPANQTLRIGHSYKPSYGTTNGFYESMTGLKKLIDIYKPFYEKHFKERVKAGSFDHNKPFKNITYILKTAKTWHGPIKDFRLTVPSTGNLIVTTMDEPLEMINGNLVIQKKDFSPDEDLTIYFFGN